jgi:hypothetical protein
MQLGLAVLFGTPSQKNDKGGNKFVDEELFINKRKPSSMMVEKKNLNKCEHTLIPVTEKIIHSAVYECKRLVLIDGQPYHMFMFFCAVRNYSENKNVMIDVEDGTGLVRVILWRKENECTAEQHYNQMQLLVQMTLTIICKTQK